MVKINKFCLLSLASFFFPNLPPPSLTTFAVKWVMATQLWSLDYIYDHNSVTPLNCSYSPQPSTGILSPLSACLFSAPYLNFNFIQSSPLVSSSPPTRISTYPTFSKVLVYIRTEPFLRILSWYPTYSLLPRNYQEWLKI